MIYLTLFFSHAALQKEEVLYACTAHTIEHLTWELKDTNARFLRRHRKQTFKKKIENKNSRKILVVKLIDILSLLTMSSFGLG